MNVAEGGLPYSVLWVHRQTPIRVHLFGVTLSCIRLSASQSGLWPHHRAM
jgi:hypothetical protein